MRFKNNILAILIAINALSVGTGYMRMTQLATVPQIKAIQNAAQAALTAAGADPVKLAEAQIAIAAANNISSNSSAQDVANVLPFVAAATGIPAPTIAALPGATAAATTAATQAATAATAAVGAAGGTGATLAPQAALAAATSVQGIPTAVLSAPSVTAAITATQKASPAILAALVKAAPTLTATLKPPTPTTAAPAVVPTTATPTTAVVPTTATPTTAAPAPAVVPTTAPAPAITTKAITITGFFTKKGKQYNNNVEFLNSLANCVVGGASNIAWTSPTGPNLPDRKNGNCTVNITGTDADRQSFIAAVQAISPSGKANNPTAALVP